MEGVGRQEQKNLGCLGSVPGGQRQSDRQRFLNLDSLGTSMTKRCHLTAPTVPRDCPKRMFWPMLLPNSTHGTLQFTLVTSYPGTPLVPEIAERELFGKCRNDLVLGDSLNSRTDTENHPDRGRNDGILITKWVAYCDTRGLKLI